MEYPTEVQNRVDVLNTYTVNDDLNMFHILHMYPGDLAYPDGYYDSRWFTLWGFNLDTQEKRNLGRHDAIDFTAALDGVMVREIRIYADGSTLIETTNPVEVWFNLTAIGLREIS